MRLPVSNLSPGDRQRAFSLIEIMVAVALLGFIIVGLLAMLFQVQRAFRIGTAQADVLEGGRATMNLLTRDIQEMAAAGLDYRGTNIAIVQAEGAVETLQDLPKPSVTPRQNYLQDFFFLSRMNDEWIGTAYRMSNAVSGVGTLYRWVERTNTYTIPEDNFHAVSNLSFHISSITPPMDTLGNFHRVLDGVVSFTVVPYDTNGVSFRNLDFYPKDSGVNFHFDPDTDVYAFMADKLPAYVDIEMAVLEPSALEKFKARADDPIRSAEFLAKQIGKTHVFRQRIAIRSSATGVGIRK